MSSQRARVQSPRLGILPAALLVLACALAAGPRAAAADVHLQVRELPAPDGSGAPIGDFSYIVNVDNTGLPFDPDPLMHPSVHPMESYSPVVAAGDETQTALHGADGQPLPAGRYLISVRAPGYKLWGRHFTIGADGSVVAVGNPHPGEPDPNATPPVTSSTLTVELMAEPLALSKLRVKVFPDFAPVNGFPDAPVEIVNAGETPPYDMSGFQIILKDEVDQVSVDFFNNPICGNGVCVTDANGDAEIPNLGFGHYRVCAVPPANNPFGWVQTTTFEGGEEKCIDAWLEEGADGNGAPGEILREPAVLTAHFFGFSKAQDFATAGSGTIKGTVRNYTAWPPGEQLTYSDPVSRPWITLTDVGGTDEQVVRIRGNADGTFQINNVPAGTYEMAIWDDPLDYIMAFYTVTVADGQTVDMGNLGIFRWFAKLSGSVFLDSDCNPVSGDNPNCGVRSPSEAGIAGMDLDIRNRDGSIYAATVTDSTGHYEYREVLSPLGKFVITEVGFPRLKVTGQSVHNELFSNGGPAADSVEKVGGPLGGDLLLNQLLIEGDHTIIDWGKKPYVGTDNGGIVGIAYYATTRNEFDPRLAAAEDYEPGIPDVLVRLWGKGADTLPNTADDILFNEYSTDHWRQPPRAATAEDPAEPPCTVIDKDGNPLPGATAQFVADNCIEVPMQRNETKDGAFDGGYAFTETCPVTVGAATVKSGPGVNPNTADPYYPYYAPGSLALEYDVDQDGKPNGRDAESLMGEAGVTVGACVGPLTPKQYVVQVVPPPFYQVIAEEDENIDEGNVIQPVPLIPPPPCTGDMHVVHDARNPSDGQSRPYCNKRLVTVQAKQNANSDFFLFTDMDVDPNTKIWTGDRRTDAVPVPGRLFGLVEDDLNLNFDTNSITFGEKRPVPGLPISIRATLHQIPGTEGFTYRKLTTAYADETGYWEALLPSTFNMFCPVPGGVCPGMYVLVLNDPVLSDPADPPVLDPNYNGAYLTEPVVFDVWPGKMTPADTPVDPTESGASCSPSVAIGPGADQILSITPELLAVSTPYGNAGTAFQVLIQGTNFGPQGTPPTATLTSAGGTVTSLAGTYAAASPPSQPEDRLTVTVPASLPAGIYQLLVTNNDSGRTGVNGISIHLRGSGYNPPLRLVSPSPDPTATPLQDAIDAANPGDLIVVAPGTYRENLILHKAVMLQGYGPGGGIGSPEQEAGGAVPPGEDPFTTIFGSVIDGRYFTYDGAKRAAWAADMNALIAAGQVGGLAPGDTVAGGAAVTVVATDGEFTAPGLPKPRIDGFGIGFARGMAGGGVYVHAFGRNLQITNDIFDNNSSVHGGAISIGEAVIEGGSLDNNNDGIGIFHNRILRNGGVRLAGAVGIFNGADNYEIAYNDFCGNASSEYGGAISHFGLSRGGKIHHNRIYSNDAFDEGGGIMIAGDAVDNPIVPGLDQLGNGSGEVVIDANLIQWNKSNDDGGGIMLLRPLDYRITITNNMIINNIAADIGGGITLDDASDVVIVNNTLALNQSTSTAEDRDLATCSPPPGSGISCPHAAGLVDTGFSAPFQTYLTTPPRNDTSTFTDPILFNDIFWQNESFFFDPAAPTVLNSAGFIDLEVFGAAGTISPRYSLLTVPYAGADGTDIVGQDPQFVAQFVYNPDVGPNRLNPNEIFLDFLRSPFLDGDYHLQPTSPAVDTGTLGPIAGVSAPPFDFDREQRPLSGIDIGADETGPVAATPVALLYFSVASNATIIPGITGARDDADIYAYMSDGTFTKVFDAIDHGVPGAANVDALKVVDATHFYLSFTNNAGVTLPGGLVAQDEDVVFYDNGTWSMYFHGADVGLSADNEDIDAFDILPGGDVLISTVGAAVTTPAFPGGTPARTRHDIERCSGGTRGATTSCTSWTLYLDGSDVGLSTTPENVDGTSVFGSRILLSTTGAYAVTGLSGGGDDIFLCNPATTGNASACGSFTMFFDGSGHGLTTATGAPNIDAFSSAVDPAMPIAGLP